MKHFTAEQLNNCSKEELIAHFLSAQQENEHMQEQLAVMLAGKYGRKTEKLAECSGQESIFNEVEATANFAMAEPEIEQVVKRKKAAGKREQDLSKFPKVIISHELQEEELRETFGDKGWKRLPDQIYSKLHVKPAVYEVYEHHIAVYASLDSQMIVKAPHPAELLSNSIATPSLVAGIMNAKYTNAMPLYRVAQEFERYDVAISRQTMSNWVIRCAERYLSLVCDKMREQLCQRHTIQADETTVKVSKDGRAAGSESYMWVYRSGEYDCEAPIIFYEYQKTRGAKHPQEFLKEFSGALVCDGYSAYHKLGKENSKILIANCWAHARRRFSNAQKALKGPNKQSAKKTLAHKALTLIGQIYAMDEKGADLSDAARTEYRQREVAPLVEAYFAWVKEHRDHVPAKSETGEGFTYSLNQEAYLKAFLTDGSIPLDNSATERAIRPFTVGRKNWMMIDTEHGAKASAMIYSLVETAKANHLKPYEYLKHLLTEIPKHMDDTNTDFLADLLPWSENLPADCRKTTTK